MSYANVPVWMRITDAPTTHAPLGNKNSGEDRKGAFPWNYHRLQACVRARAAGQTWGQIAQHLIYITGVHIEDQAVASRIRRFEEEEREA